MDGIEKDQHVNISYCQDGGTWISVAGKASVSDDRTKIKGSSLPLPFPTIRYPSPFTTHTR